MKVLDANVLLNAVHAQSLHHRLAKSRMESALADAQGVGLVWLVLVAFVRLSTKRGILPLPLTIPEALAILDGWLAQPNVRVLSPGPRHAGVFGRLLLEAGVGGDLSNDAHIAAIAIEHDAEVITFDPDFSRFTGLKLQLLA